MSDTRVTSAVEYICYPESMVLTPPDIIDLCQNKGLSCVISPLHDKDLGTDGSVKKPHYHVYIKRLTGSKLSLQFETSYSSLIGAARFTCVDSWKGALLYACHLNSTGKHLYDVNDVLTTRDIDYKASIASETELPNSLIDILNIINTNDFIYFHNLVDYIIANDKTLFPILKRNRAFIVSYLKSRAAYSSYH